MREFVVSILALLTPWKLKKKIDNFRLLISMKRYSNLFHSKCKRCGKTIRIHYPLSLKGLDYIEVGDNFKLGYYSSLEAWDLHNNVHYEPSIVIGDNVSFGNYCHIGCIKQISIGNNVLTGANVLIIDHNHGRSDRSDIMLAPNDRILSSNGTITIGDNVWIGEKSTILGGVSIGDNCIIGANSVVTKSIPANCIAAGSPAKVIKTIVET